MSFFSTDSESQPDPEDETTEYENQIDPDQQHIDSKLLTNMDNNIEVSNIDFTSSNKKIKMDDACASTSSSSDSQPSDEKIKIEPPTAEERFEFLKKLMNSNAKSVILTVTAPFNEAFIPASVHLGDDFSVPLNNIKSEKNITETSKELQKETESVKLKVRKKSNRIAAKNATKKKSM